MSRGTAAAYAERTRRRPRRGRRGAAPSLLQNDYWSISRRPLQILAFLLPFAAGYELALLFVLRGEHGTIDIEAHATLLRFFRTFGIGLSGWYLPGLALLVVLLLWHVLNRDPWMVDLRATGLMAVESLILAVPLLVVAQIVARAGLASVGPGVDPAELGTVARIAISVGAGIYEELVFRMLLVAIIHAVVVDVARQSHATGATIAVLASAALFTAYHPDLTAERMVFFFVAGVYFGAVYIMRGFGIVVGAHAFYDIVTATFLWRGGV
jgi:hypothetical protein